ncbi:MAG: hypothetical protein KAT58_06600 [candidate division Zixibacteria bacterium]|nr:hypothetical protein [candidate division Zixibacteria bacterium]
MCATLATSATAFQLDSPYLDVIRRGMELTITDHYDDACVLFDSLISEDSTDHAAYLFLAGVYHAEMTDREDYADIHLFHDSIEKAIRLARKAIKENNNPAWAYLTCGNAHGYVAAYEGKNGSWFAALKQGIKAKNCYLKALAQDSTLYDAYLGLGTYHYWKSAKTEFINWLPFVKDRKQQGLYELQLAVDSSLFSGDMAISSLIWIHLHRGDPISAMRLSQALRARYPHSRLAIWGLAFSSLYSGKLHAAADCFGELIEAVADDPEQNYFNLIECRWHRGVIFRRVGQRQKALEELDLLLNYPLSDDVAKRQQEKINKARKLKDELEL